MCICGKNIRQLRLFEGTATWWGLRLMRCKWRQKINPAPSIMLSAWRNLQERTRSSENLGIGKSRSVPPVPSHPADIKVADISFITWQNPICVPTVFSKKYIFSCPRLFTTNRWNQNCGKIPPIKINVLQWWQDLPPTPFFIMANYFSKGTAKGTALSCKKATGKRNNPYLITHLWFPLFRDGLKYMINFFFRGHDDRVRHVNIIISMIYVILGVIWQVVAFKCHGRNGMISKIYVILSMMRGVTTFECGGKWKVFDEDVGTQFEYCTIICQRCDIHMILPHFLSVQCKLLHSTCLQHLVARYLRTAIALTHFQKLCHHCG